MKVKYIRKAIWQESLKNFKDKKVKMDADLKSMGINRKIPLTRVIHLASTKPITIGNFDNNWREEIKRMARRSKKWRIKEDK